MKYIGFLTGLFFVLLMQSCSKSGGSGESSTGVSSTAFAGSGGSSGGGGGNGNPGAGVMTAGEWNDLDNWDFWTTLIQKDTIKTYPQTWGFFTKNRISIVLRDIGGRLIHDAKLTITNGSQTASAVTDNFGRAELFAGLFIQDYTASSYSLTANYNGQTFNLGIVSPSPAVATKTIAVNKVASNTLDVMFVVDATGSMGDELNYLKTEIKDVISRAGSQLPGVQIRMGSVYYRDRGDQYLTRPFNFTTNVDQLSNFIGQQNAGGGGDFPEAVDEALHVAINNMQWSNKAVNRLAFLILDAPPHKSEMAKLKNAITAGQQKGIRIIPVSASGIDRETEFLLRFLSISTNSTYVFITNDSGIGNPHLTPTVGSYQVEFLNNLMVRLIARYGKNMD